MIIQTLINFTRILLQPFSQNASTFQQSYILPSITNINYLDKLFWLGLFGARIEDIKESNKKNIINAVIDLQGLVGKNTLSPMDYEEGIAELRECNDFFNQIFDKIIYDLRVQIKNKSFLLEECKLADLAYCEKYLTKQARAKEYNRINNYYNKIKTLNITEENYHFIISEQYFFTKKKSIYFSFINFLLLALSISFYLLDDLSKLITKKYSMFFILLIAGENLAYVSSRPINNCDFSKLIFQSGNHRRPKEEINLRELKHITTCFATQLNNTVKIPYYIDNQEKINNTMIIFKDNITDIQYNMDVIDNKINHNSTNLDQRINHLNINILDIDKKLNHNSTALDRKIDYLNTDVQNLSDELNHNSTNLDQRINHLNINILDIDKKLNHNSTALDRKIDYLNTDVQNLSDELNRNSTNLDQRINHLNTDIHDMKDKLNYNSTVLDEQIKKNYLEINNLKKYNEYYNLILDGLCIDALSHALDKTLRNDPYPSFYAHLCNIALILQDKKSKETHNILIRSIVTEIYSHSTFEVTADFILRKELENFKCKLIIDYLYYIGSINKYYDNRDVINLYYLIFSHCKDKKKIIPSFFNFIFSLQADDLTIEAENEFCTNNNQCLEEYCVKKDQYTQEPIMEVKTLNQKKNGCYDKFYLSFYYQKGLLINGGQKKEFNITSNKSSKKLDIQRYGSPTFFQVKIKKNKYIMTDDTAIVYIPKIDNPEGPDKQAFNKK